MGMGPWMMKFLEKDLKMMNAYEDLEKARKMDNINICCCTATMAMMGFDKEEMNQEGNFEFTGTANIVNRMINAKLSLTI